MLTSGHNAKPTHLPQTLPYRPHIVKQGFVYKRGGSGLLTHWKLKFLVLTTSPSNPYAYTLQIYDKREQISPAKYEIKCDEVGTNVQVEKIKFDVGAAAENMFRKMKRLPFAMVTKDRKFLFASQTPTDHQEWVAALQKCTSPNIKSNPVQHITPSSSYPNTDSSRTMVGLSSTARHDEDAMSTFSDDSRFTGHHGSIRRISRPSSLYDHEDGQSVLSIVETMSFRSEPILTIQELSNMGHETTIANKTIDPMRKRALQELESHNSSHHSWNDRYQSILKGEVGGEESLLKKDILLVEVIGAFQEHATFHAKDILDKFHLLNSPHLRDQLEKDNRRGLFGFRSSVTEGREDENATSSWTFRSDGVIYQFCANYEELNLEEIDLSHTQTSQELSGITIVNSSNCGLSTPLTCLVDYKGFRVICYADMEAQGDELLTLTHDLTSERPKVDEDISKLLGCVGRYSNLKPHAVMLNDDRRVMVHSASGIEIHRGSSQSISYATNLHQLFPLDFCPPENPNPPSPTKSISSTTQTLSPSTPPTPLIFSNSPSLLRRLRPEFVRDYPQPLCSDGLTSWSSYSLKEREGNDMQVMRAGRYLRETWIPAFVRKLDELEIRVVDARCLALEMHRAGVNMRYIGLIARLSKIPFVRDFAGVEMISRAVKCLFRHKMRCATLQFRAVGATNIDEQMKEYAVGMFNLVLGAGEKNEKNWTEKIQPEIFRKFEYEMDFHQFSGLHRPCLFLSLQYHCGIAFQESTTYNFNTTTPLTKTEFLHFIPKTKHTAGVSIRHPNAREGSSFKLQPEETLAYHLARHFKSVGPHSKLSRKESSAQALTEIASYYNSTGRHEEARTYATSACAASRSDSCIKAFALAQVIETLSGLQLNSSAAPDASLMHNYKMALEAFEWHYGQEHPLSMGLHDRMSAVYFKAKRLKESLHFHMISLGIALKSLGKHHAVTAGYLVKSGIILSMLERTEESIKRLTEAMHVYQSLKSDPTLIAEVHFHMATSLASRGDLDGALHHATRCKKLRESKLGQHDRRTVEAYSQLSNLLLSPYQEYKGVLTPLIRKHYMEAILCLEKVFRYLKSMRRSTTGYNSGQNYSVSGSSTPVGNKSVSRHRRSKSLVIQLQQTHFHGFGGFCGGFLLSDGGHSAPIAGPFFSPPFAPTPPLSPKRLLHQLTKKIVMLKLELLDQPGHIDVVRTARQAMREDGELVPSSDDVRRVIVRLAAVSPSIYLDGLFARLDDEDETAEEEIQIVIQLCERDTVGVA